MTKKRKQQAHQAFIDEKGGKIGLIWRLIEQEFYSFIWWHDVTLYFDLNQTKKHYNWQAERKHRK